MGRWLCSRKPRTHSSSSSWSAACVCVALIRGPTWRAVGSVRPGSLHLGSCLSWWCARCLPCP
eukprot:6861288-Pyramimonas_sp.AAC.1